MEENLKRAILIAVNVGDEEYFIESLNELEELVKACNMNPIGTMIQNLEHVNNALYIGTGKVEEVREKIAETNADILVFNNELTPSQIRNLQKSLDIPILDRTALILDIFQSRARTKEAKLQVEVAKLKYMLPRLTGLHDSLGRQGGASGLSNKGAGEKKIELDRRKIEDKIAELSKELKNIVNEREVQRKQRKKSGIPLVSLAGYTNAGKSTLLNALVDIFKSDDTKKVEEKDMLFATLETSVRNITLQDNKQFLLSDTVGFISHLPHELVKAFRSTLEEIKQADLILQVIDYSDVDYNQHIKVTNDTLRILGAQDIPVIYVYNKSDLVLNKIPIVEGDNKIYISASKKIGIEELIELIKKQIFSDYVKVKLLIPYDKGNIVSYFNEVATVNYTEYVENGTIIDVECKQSDYNKYSEYEVK